MNWTRWKRPRRSPGRDSPRNRLSLRRPSPPVPPARNRQLLTLNITENRHETDGRKRWMMPCDGPAAMQLGAQRRRLRFQEPAAYRISPRRQRNRYRRLNDIRCPRETFHRRRFWRPRVACPVPRLSTIWSQSPCTLSQVSDSMQVWRQARL
jgi:hypothetical protein